MVRAQDVSAAIRFRPLFRGRLEIAGLSATEPSINLVRNDQGRWNLASPFGTERTYSCRADGEVGFGASSGVFPTLKRRMLASTSRLDKPRNPGH